MTESELHTQCIAPSTPAVEAQPSECVAASQLLCSRVGRALQRYDGDVRLLACVVVVRTNTTVHTQEQQQQQQYVINSSSSHNDTHDRLQVLLISSSKHPNEWILPKGGWESDETLIECALREADEEAGVRTRSARLQRVRSCAAIETRCD